MVGENLNRLIMLSEKDLEDAIANNPKKYIGEDGLKLIGRQFRIGGYIFDLIFQDRHNAKLIVEIQKGTLDRQHTYKILDYYDAYREQHPDEFIELMVIANMIPIERKKRLNAMGVDYREISEYEFIEPNEIAQIVTDEKPMKTLGTNKPANSRKTDESNDETYQLFKNQKNLFVKELKDDFNVHFILNWKNVDIGKRSNWFICWVPLKWGIPKKGFGIHYDFKYYRDRNGVEFVRMPVGIENPLKPEFREDFKREVIDQLTQQNLKVENCRLWPDAGFQGAKLLEPEPIALNRDTYKIMIKLYSSLSKFNIEVGEVVRQFYNRDCFSSPLTF